MEAVSKRDILPIVSNQRTLPPVFGIDSKMAKVALALLTGSLFVAYLAGYDVNSLGTVIMGAIIGNGITRSYTYFSKKNNDINSLENNSTHRIKELEDQMEMLEQKVQVLREEKESLEIREEEESLEIREEEESLEIDEEMIHSQKVYVEFFCRHFPHLKKSLENKESFVEQHCLINLELIKNQHTTILNQLPQTEITEEIVELLIANGAKPNTKTLHNALKKHGTIPNVPTSWILTPIKIFKRFLEEGAVPTTKTLLKVLAPGILEEKLLKMFVKARAKPTTEVLNICCRYFCYTKPLKMLIKNGAKPDFETLNLAVQKANDKVVEILLKRITPNTDILKNAKKQYIIALVKAGATPTTGILNRIVMERGNLETIRILLEHGAQPNIETLNIAAEKSSPEIMAILLNYVQPTIETLNLATEWQSLEVMQMIMEKGILPTDETLIKCFDKNETSDKIDTVIKAGIKPTTAILEYAIKDNPYNLNAITLLMLNGAIPTKETIKLYRESEMTDKKMRRFLECCAIAITNSADKTEDKKIKNIIEKYHIINSNNMINKIDYSFIKQAARFNASDEAILMLIEACEFSLTEILNKFVVQGVTPLVIKTLIKKGAIPTTDTLNKAASRAYNSLEVLQILIESGVQPTEETLQILKNRHANSEKIKLIQNILVSKEKLLI